MEESDLSELVESSSSDDVVEGSGLDVQEERESESKLSEEDIVIEAARGKTSNL